MLCRSAQHQDAVSHGLMSKSAGPERSNGDSQQSMPCCGWHHAPACTGCVTCCVAAAETLHMCKTPCWLPPEEANVCCRSKSFDSLISSSSSTAEMSSHLSCEACSQLQDWQPSRPCMTHCSTALLTGLPVCNRISMSQTERGDVSVAAFICSTGAEGKSCKTLTHRAGSHTTRLPQYNCQTSH